MSGVEGGRRTATIERFAVIYVDLRNYSLDPVCYCAIVEWTRKFKDGVCSWFRGSSNAGRWLLPIVLFNRTNPRNLIEPSRS